MSVVLNCLAPRPRANMSGAWSTRLWHSARFGQSRLLSLIVRPIRWLMDDKASIAARASVMLLARFGFPLCQNDGKAARTLPIRKHNMYLRLHSLCDSTSRPAYTPFPPRRTFDRVRWAERRDSTRHWAQVAGSGMGKSSSAASVAALPLMVAPITPGRGN